MKKLTLAKETLRLLSPDQVSGMNAGMAPIISIDFSKCRCPEFPRETMWQGCNLWTNVVC